MVHLSLSAALIAGMVGLTACGTRTDNNNVKTQSLRNNNVRNYDVNSLPQGNRLFSRSAGNGQSERITSLKYSPALSNKVAGLSDIQTAHVVVTDRDAYVAVTLHGTNNNPGTGSGISEMSTGRSTGINNHRGMTNSSGSYGANSETRGSGGNGGLARGLTGRSGTAGSLLDINRGDGGMGTGTFNGVENGTEAGRVTDNVTQQVKDQVTDVIKKTAPNIRNVYVSNDSDFVSRVGSYATESRGGSALQDMISDFQTMIDRVFPSRAGTMTGPNGYAPTQPSGINNRGMTPAGINNNGYSGGVTR
ncbi:YhcN/YlaJ family sporulation lipoprotein [Paenibacillus antibioticophila]|uniref:YhcN/YlaJ family sporulation lipoprotein n=1 Tax=Paenibacillus antibioticophila TaxID=1274374 RepID=UPI0013052DF6|nr:YhcN/YlaJ family sporulation lipoprotein [Paenibacillus antibioticophila]